VVLTIIQAECKLGAYHTGTEFKYQGKNCAVMSFLFTLGDL